MQIRRLISKYFFKQSRRRRAAPNCAADVLESRRLMTVATASFNVSHDTTLYSGEGELANGNGEYLLAGSNARSLIQFDLSAIPEGATILDAVLTLNVGQASSATQLVTVSPVLAAWSSGASNATGDETTGAAAEQFDATWRYRFFGGEEWSTPGGDIGGVSASAAVGGQGAYEWLGGGLINDIQAWVDNASANFGWAIDTVGGLKAFVSSDSGNSVLQPQLEVTYEAPPETQVVIEGRVWNDRNADGRGTDNALGDLNLEIFGRDYFNAFGGQEYWFRSTDTQRWHFLRPDGTVTRWDGTSGQLSGDIVRRVDPRFYYNPDLVVKNEDAEPWVNGHTVELLDAGGSVIATTTTSSRDLNGDGVIDPDLENGWYVFHVTDDSQQYSVRYVTPDGWESSGQIEYDTTSPLERLANQLQLEQRTSLYEDWGGLGEKWLFSTLSGWHFITPNGNLYRWDGQQPTEDHSLSGELVAKVGSSAHADPTVILADSLSDPAVDGEVILRIDFGAYEVFDVTGRVWNDVNPNGQRDAGGIAIPNRPSSVELAEGEDFYFDSLSDSWYVVNTDGELSYWGPNDSEDTDGGNSSADTDSDGEVQTPVVIQLEPWLNNRIVELLDLDGNVVATTVSRSIDLNGDGEISYETERGHYVFENVRAGEYTIRTQSADSWVQTSPVGSNHAFAIELDDRHDFQQTSNDFYNWAGQSERWIIDGAGAWYYVLPDGGVYQWDSTGEQADTGLNGQLIAQLSGAFYEDLSLLTDPDASSSRIDVGDGNATMLLFGSYDETLRDALL